MGDWDRFCSAYGLDFYTDPTIFSERTSYSSNSRNKIKFEPRYDFLFLSFQEALAFLRKNRKDKHGVPRIIRRLNVNTDKNHDFFICLSIRESYDYREDDVVYCSDLIPSVIYESSTDEYIDSVIPERLLSKYGISSEEKKYRMFSSSLFLKSNFRDYYKWKSHEISCRKIEHELQNKQQEECRIAQERSGKWVQREDGSWMMFGLPNYNWDRIYERIYNEARNNNSKI